MAAAFGGEVPPVPKAVQCELPRETCWDARWVQSRERQIGAGRLPGGRATQQASGVAERKIFPKALKETLSSLLQPRRAWRVVELRARMKERGWPRKAMQARERSALFLF